jgi:hypothetical protein
MIDQALLNHAAGVLKTISADQRADTALRFYFERHAYIQPPARRIISQTVFVYFRWFQWLDEKASPQKRLEQAQALHERFTADPKSVKAEALAALRDCLDEYQNPIPEKTMLFQIGLAVKEASDLAFVPPAYRHLASL